MAYVKLMGSNKSVTKTQDQSRSHGKGTCFLCTFLVSLRQISRIDSGGTFQGGSVSEA